MPKSITRETPFGRLTFTAPLETSNDTHVMVHRPKGNVIGYWTLDRFGGELNAQGVKAWIDHVSSKNKEN